MRARLISTDGEYLEARIDIDGAVLHVMDEFSPAECGEVLDIELIPMLDEHESNNDILDGNPDRKRGLERIEGWSYRAFGIICSLSPVTVDCGQIRFEDDDFEPTGSGIRQAVAFTISRLTARRRTQAAKTAPAALLPIVVDDATAATYHDLGYRLDIFDENFVKDWAYQIIGERDTPPIAIIEVATAANRDALYSALSIAGECGNRHTATRLLLGHIARGLSGNRISTRSAIRAAMTLCNDDSLDDSAYIDFMRFNEDIHINEYAANRSDEDMRSEALRLLAGHAQLQDTPPRGNKDGLGAISRDTHAPSDCSVRAASWIAARCVRAYSERRHLMIPDLDAFCRHLEALISADDVSDWDNHGMTLAITGLGDALPPPLDQAPELAMLVEHAREISATQIYGAWQPAVVARHLKSCLDIAGTQVLGDVPDRILSHRPLHHGWGDPLPRLPRPERGPE